MSISIGKSRNDSKTTVIKYNTPSFIKARNMLAVREKSNYRYRRHMQKIRQIIEYWNRPTDVRVGVNHVIFRQVSVELKNFDEHIGLSTIRTVLAELLCC